MTIISQWVALIVNYLRYWFISDKRLARKYVLMGRAFGEIICDGYSSDLPYVKNRWKKLEREYSERSYRTLSVDEFISCADLPTGEADKIIERLILKPLEPGEYPVLHGEYYPRRPPVVRLRKFSPLIRNRIK